MVPILLRWARRLNGFVPAAATRRSTTARTEILVAYVGGPEYATLARMVNRTGVVHVMDTIAMGL